MTARSSRRPTGPVVFAELALVAAATALVAVIAFALRSPEPVDAGFAVDESSTQDDGGAIDLDDGVVADPDLAVDAVVASAAEAMGAVTSVEFFLVRDGAPVYIDEFESLALDELLGQFSVPSRAQAQVTVTVDDSLTTEIGAVAFDDEVWLSNPVTGDFETLPPGIDLDPSRFFDPAGGWQPLLANLQDVELVAIDDRGGERYHVHGVARSADVENLTVGLVRDQDVAVDLWIHPTTFLVTHLELDTVIDGATSSWSVDLGRYGDDFVIRPPANVRSGGGS